MTASDTPSLPARVLHLEDDAKDHKLVRAALVSDKIDHRIERVDSADAFRAALSAACFDLVLSDYNLGGFDGFTALGIARELCPDVPFVVVSGAMGDMAVADILRAGATDFVLKEHLDRLGPSIRRALREAAERKARRAAEAAVRVARDAAEAANRSKDRFLAMLSHELRTPLSPVVMALKSMQADPEFPDRFADDLSMVRRNIDLEVALIDDLLDLSRVVSGKLRLREADVSLHALVHHVLLESETAAAEKGLTVLHRLQASGERVLGDAARLQQVISNLVRNAIKFTPAGGRIEVATQDVDGGLIRLTVTDTGRGIPADALPRLFEPFEQVSADVTHEFGGLGMGLAIVRAVVDLHNGRTAVRSAGPGQGATFTVELPATLGEAHVKTPHDPSNVGAASTAAPAARVLLVEDHDDTRHMLHRLLKVAGFEIGVASTVAAALELAGQRTFDVLVSDIGLPDASGYELMAELRTRYGMKGIALSGFGMEDDMARGRECGFAQHLVKPIDLDQLRKAIRAVTGL